MGLMGLVNVASQVPLAMVTATMQHIEETESHPDFKVFDSAASDSVVSSDWIDFLVAHNPHYLILVLLE